MSKPFILVAEDDADDKFLFKSIFEEDKNNLALDFVENGVELLDYLHSIKANKAAGHYPCLILLDLNMPKMDGKEALKKIKSEPDYSKIPVVVFSTTKNEKEIKHCYELGADSYIVKPSSYINFLKAIDSIKNYCANLLNISNTPSIG